MAEGINTRDMLLTRERTVRFWLVSILVNLIVFGVLIYFLPEREIIVGRKKTKLTPEITMKDEELSTLITRIRETQIDKLKSRILLLGRGTDRMRINLLNKQRLHTGFETAQKRAVFDRISERFGPVFESQDTRIRLHKKYENKPFNPEESHEVQLCNVRIRSALEDIDAALPLLPASDERKDLEHQAGKVLEAETTAGACLRCSSVR